MARSIGPFHSAQHLQGRRTHASSVGHGGRNRGGRGRFHRHVRFDFTMGLRLMVVALVLLTVTGMVAADEGWTYQGKTVVVLDVTP